MFKIDNKKVDITQEEFDFYSQLVQTFTTPDCDGRIYFRDLFTTDNDGYIMMINTTKSVPWSILFFIQQLMINQRLRVIDDFRRSNSK